MTKELIKLALSLGITALGKLIPFLGGFLGGPLGFIISPILGYLSGLLYDWIEQMARFNAIDAQAKKDSEAHKASATALKEVQKNPDATEEQRAKAISDFMATARNLGRIRVHKDSN